MKILILQGGRERQDDSLSVWAFDMASGWQQDGIWEVKGVLDLSVLRLIERIVSIGQSGIIFECVNHNCEKSSKRWEYQTTLPAFWETCIQVKKQQLESDTEIQTSSKLGKEYIKAICCHPAYLTSMQSTPCKMPVWMKLKLESRSLEKYQ